MNNNKPKAPSAWVSGPAMSWPQTQLDRDIQRFQLLVLDAKACRSEDDVSFMRYFRQIHSLWIKYLHAHDLGLTSLEEMNELRDIAKRHKAEAMSQFWSEIDELEEHLFTRCVHDHRRKGKRDHHMIRLLFNHLWDKRARFRNVFGGWICRHYVLTMFMDEYRAQLDDEQCTEDLAKGLLSTNKVRQLTEPCAA